MKWGDGEDILILISYEIAGLNRKGFWKLIKSDDFFCIEVYLEYAFLFGKNNNKF